MGLIRTDDLQPQMILASDLRSMHGRLLLPMGTCLTVKHLSIIKMWGVAEANIADMSEEKVEAARFIGIAPELLEHGRRHAARHFVLVDSSSEVMREMADLFVVRFCKRRDPNVRTFLSEPPRPCRKDLPGLSMKKVLQQAGELVSQPEIYTKIVAAVNNPRSSAFYLADIIGKDPSLSAKLLRLVNSAAYGFSQQIDTLSRAVTIVGMDELSTLALGISIIENFRGISPQLLDMKSFWKHSLICGMVARHFAGQRQGLSEERFFVAGLLHDIGRLVLLKHHPDIIEEALYRARQELRLLQDVEKELLGFDHAELGSALMKNWKLPSFINDAVLFHHCPAKAPEPLGPGIVHLADILANVLAPGASGNFFVPPLEASVWQSLGFSKNMLSLIVTQVDHQIDELLRVFFHEDT